MNRCMYHAAFSIFSMCLTATACVTQPKPNTNLETKVESWLGTRQADVESYWGGADEILEMGEGMRLLQYEAEVAEESPVEYPCVVIFSVNRYGFVLGSKWNGDRASCEAFVKEIPEEEKSLVRKTNIVILEAIENVQSN